jgi:hypothetical protein
MNDLDSESTLVLDVLKEAFRDVPAPSPLEEVVAAGRARRRRRRLLEGAGAATVAGLVAAFAVSLGAPTRAHTPAPGEGAAPSHPSTAAFMVDTNPNGTVTVTWDKRAYFEDPVGLQDALRHAGFPVLVRVGEFCKGPNDNGVLDPSGQAAAVDQVMRASRAPDGEVAFTFVPSAMPPGTELFIGYLSPAQLAVTHGRPGSVERLVPTNEPLTCTSQAPAPNTSTGPPTPRPAAEPSPAS